MPVRSWKSALPSRRARLDTGLVAIAACAASRFAGEDSDGSGGGGGISASRGWVCVKNALNVSDALTRSLRNGFAGPAKPREDGFQNRTMIQRDVRALSRRLPRATRRTRALERRTVWSSAALKSDVAASVKGLGNHRISAGGGTTWS